MPGRGCCVLLPGVSQIPITKTAGWVVDGHVYSGISVANAVGSGTHDLVLFRNPHGCTEYQGPWKDGGDSPFYTRKVNRTPPPIPANRLVANDPPLPPYPESQIPIAYCILHIPYSTFCISLFPIKNF